MLELFRHSLLTTVNIMKNILWTLPAAAIAVIAGCQKPTDQVCEVSPEIFLTTEKVTAPADGGKCSIVYRIDDPSVDGKMTHAPSDDWMSGFIVSDTLITFEVEADSDGKRAALACLVSSIPDKY